MKADTVFFDLDETLIRNTGDAGKTFFDVYQSYPDTLDPSAFDQFMTTLFANARDRWDNMFQQDETPKSIMIGGFVKAVESVGGDSRIANDFFERFISAGKANTLLTQDAVDTLDRLRARGKKVGIITNGLEAMQLAKIDQHSLAEHVDVVVVSEQARAHKPSKVVFNYALSRVGGNPETTWHVGDHLTNDIAGAKGAGMVAVHFYNEKPLSEVEKEYRETEIEPHFSIAALADVLDLMD
jgi:putative hydrolase of the HAD superfamily